MRLPHAAHGWRQHLEQNLPPANRVVILQFENMDKVKAWRDVARDAQEKIGKKYATFRTFAVEGIAQY